MNGGFLQTLVHYGLHLLAPLGLAFLCFRKRPWRAYGILLATMLIDLDHLLATPVFMPGRCSIGFHPLHTLPALIGYGLLLLFGRGSVRIIAVGLTFHLFTDFIDCLWMYRTCAACLEGQRIVPLFQRLFG
ncbi:MAG: hypothetical protein EOP52_08920 [Sphingobacteriales bacterium]|nr:MAG: hypothetical protein EOP52_08920 [Sphingobacteriales bacterium]